MSTPYDNLSRILNPITSREQRLSAIRGFATDLHWTPSFEMHGAFGVTGAEDHLVVEHGLENSAIISFLRSPLRTADLDPIQLRSLLTISFNNLVEWHVFVSETQVRYINNRTEPYFDRVFSFTRASTDFASVDQFEKITNVDFANEKYSRTIQSCDDALIRAISHWKRLLKADYRALTNEHISALINSVIFTRACEDQRRMQTELPPRLLSRALEALSGENIRFSDCIAAALAECGVQDAGRALDLAKLAELPPIDKLTALLLSADFYRPSFSAYDFNFALMSKHALSRIYERYVTLLEFDDTDETQISFIAQLPKERDVTKSGVVYTPLFVASFFARFLRDNLTPKAFRQIKVIDPACGSGIFLRTLLELQCNPLVPGTTPQAIQAAFDRTYAIDRDANACQATRLSLALLHLVATGTLPQKLNVLAANAIELAVTEQFPTTDVGAVVANPPYIKLEHLTPDDQRIYDNYLQEYREGRVDSYLAFLKLCLTIVSEGGFVCLVLPQVFLLAKNAGPFRKRIAEQFDVRCLVDLSAVSVFEHVGAYSVLLVLQKRMPRDLARPPAHVARIQGSVGPALQAVLDGQAVETTYYTVFDVDQDFFRRDEWILLSAPEISLERKLAQLRPISNYLDVRQGFITGADEIFIRPKNFIQKQENSVYVDYLPDRSIGKYRLPKKVDQAVFYPFESGSEVSEARLKKAYPETWKYLSGHRSKLSKRKSAAESKAWWWPVRPREPKSILSPKIVCPHLMLTPRFAVDLRGSFAVSRSPFLIPKAEQYDPAFLKFFCAVLNSSVCQWFFSTHAPKYSRGYNRIEVPVLKSVPVPDPAQVHSATFNEIVRLVDEAMSREGTEIHSKLDDLVLSLYELSDAELKKIKGPTS